MRRIFLITDHFAAGGIGTVVLKEAGIFSVNGYKVYIVANKIGAVKEKDWEKFYPGIFHQINKHNINLITIYPNQLKKIFDKIASDDIVIIHTSWRGRELASSDIIQKYKGKQLYFFIHNSSSKEPPQIKSTLLHNLHIAKGIFAGSIYVIGDLRFLGITTPIFFIDYGAPVEFIKEGFNIDVKEKIKRKSVLYIGRLLKEKGGHILFETIRLVTDQKKDIKFIIHGSFRESELNVPDDLLMNPNIHVTKAPLGYTDMINLYKQTTLLLQPSLKGEGQPLVVLEALALKTFVIATKYGIGGLRNPSGVYVTEPEVISRDIIYLLDSPSIIEKYIERGFKYIKNMTWEQHVKQMLKVVEVYS